METNSVPARAGCFCSHGPEISRHPHAKEIMVAFSEETEAQGVEISWGSHSTGNSNRI